MSVRSHPDDADRANRWPWPPILDAATLVAAAVLQRVVPMPAISQARPMQWAGSIVCAIGVVIAVAGIVQFRRIGTPIDPTARATVVARGGIYAWTRNPMYVGTLVAFLGLGLAWPSTWLIVLLPVLAFGLFKLAIEREEAFLERRFGDDYRSYKAQVRRWL